MGEKGYNTNLAAEFHVLSVLHRLGLAANLTLGNKKSVDIAVVPEVGEAYTIDVKGLAGKTGWPVDNVREPKPRHFIAIVCFLGSIGDPQIAPELYIVPSMELGELTYNAPKSRRRLVQLSTMRQRGMKYRDGWKSLI